MDFELAEFLFCEDINDSDNSLESDSFLSSSAESDVSSDDSDCDDTVSLILCKNERHCIDIYLAEVVPTYTEQEFITHFRVTCTIFENLCKNFLFSKEFKALDSTKAFSPKVHIALFLWFAGHEACSFRDIADRFNVSIGTVSHIITRVIYFISNMSNSVIRWPTDEEKKITANDIKAKTGLDGALGAIHGTHIRIDPPKGFKDSYIDQKNIVSIQMQGICNEKNKFIDIFVGFPGSTHYNRVFENSDIFPKLKMLCGSYYILADSAYTCSDLIITPFKDNDHLTPQQKNFNRKLSSGTGIIQHAFGLLKQRFRQLYYCKLRGHTKMCHFVRACVVLHNLCDDNLAALETFVQPPEENDERSAVFSDGSIPPDITKRNQLCAQLNAATNKK